MTDYSDEVVERVARKFYGVDYTDATDELWNEEESEFRDRYFKYARYLLSIVGPLVEAIVEVEAEHPVCAIPDEHIQRIWSICEKTLASPVLKELGL